MSPYAVLKSLAKSTRLRLCRALCPRVLESFEGIRFELASASVVQPHRLVDVSEQVFDIVEPYFVLSTGRCGTRWLTELLRHSDQVVVNHALYPELIRHSRLAYEQYDQHPRVFQEIVRATRDELILLAHTHRRLYVETNNRITFFAPATNAVYPQARFIHLYRHPGDFICSGMRRNWYEGHDHDLGRITYRDDAPAWQVMAKAERIAWLWNETNQFIQDFLASVSPQHWIQVKAEDMWTDPSISEAICRFIGIQDIPPGTIRRMLTRKVNAQKKGSSEQYSQWSQELEMRIRELTPLAVTYGYRI